MSHTRWSPVYPSTARSCFEQSPHTTRPHARQWCLRRSPPKACVQHGQCVASASGSHSARGGMEVSEPRPCLGAPAWARPRAASRIGISQGMLAARRISRHDASMVPHPGALDRGARSASLAARPRPARRQQRARDRGARRAHRRRPAASGRRRRARERAAGGGRAPTRPPPPPPPRDDAAAADGGASPAVRAPPPEPR